MRVGIYNRYWSTQGGGERYAGTIAEALRDTADVDLIGVESIDVAKLGAGIEVDLDGARFVRWPPLACSRLVPFTRSYDLLINATYGSSMRSQARRSAYVVLFPHTLRSRPVAAVQGAVRALVRAVAPWQLKFVGGHYDPDANGACWLGPDAWLRLSPRAFRDGTASLRLRRSGAAPVRIVSVEGPIAEWSSGPEHLMLKAGRVPDAPVEIRVRTEPFVPRDLGLNEDARQLGVCLDLGSHRTRLARLGRSAELTRTGRDFLQDYDMLLAISEYTRRWVRRRWGQDSVLLPPPVDTERFGAGGSLEKQRVVLSVGRFFAAAHHNKKHVEMLRAFRHMCDRGRVPAGWEYRLAGRVHRERPEHVSYFDEVRRLAEGYPVRILSDIPYDRLVEEYRAASIFWHASGWGEDDHLYPERFEHFGITTCEAMSAGCIPVVIAKAGQAEIVKDGVDGYTFLTADELIAKTTSLMASFGTQRNTDLADAARRSAQRFGKAAFVDGVRRHLGPMLEGGAGG